MPKKIRLYDEFIRRLIEVNDETKTPEEHQRLTVELRAWEQGVEDATGFRFNGDYYYIGLGINRPMCTGLFLDWEHREKK